MKRIVMLMLMIAGAIFCAPLHAERKVAILKCGEIFKVIYKGDPQAVVRLKILDNAGHAVFEEKILSHEGSFIRPYNLSELPMGDYKICVTDHAGELTERVSHQEKIWPVHLSTIDQRENKYLLAIPGQPGSSVDISIFDRDQRLVFSEKHWMNEGYARIYHLKKLEGATIVVEDKNSKEKKVFSLD